MLHIIWEDPSHRSDQRSDIFAEDHLPQRAEPKPTAYPNPIVLHSQPGSKQAAQSTCDSKCPCLMWLASPRPAKFPPATALGATGQTSSTDTTELPGVDTEELGEFTEE